MGVFPIPVCAPPRGERKGRVGEVEAEQEEDVRRVATGALLLGIVGDARSRTRVKPFVTAEEPNRSGTPP
jgi:hypothetical protein